MALQGQLQRFGHWYGVATELVGSEALSPGAVEPAAELELLRIVQEALSDVRKHAAAAHVRVAQSARRRHAGGDRR